MQISESWLREYVNPDINTEELAEQLTMAGLEVDSVKPAGTAFSGVVVAEVLHVESHPDADKLRVCQVNVGGTDFLQIVCGASNVRNGLKVPAALIGAILPGDFKIKQSKLRGVDSFGMLCSEKEIGVAEEASGLMELPQDAPIGIDIRDYLNLNDHLIEVDLTPNRADCLSVEGIAREVAVLNKLDWQPAPLVQTPVKHQDNLTITVAEKSACPKYLGRLIKDINPLATTPAWLQERLRRSGVRSLGPVVDITNYVLLDMGQPMHAFDADKLDGQITVRHAKKTENLVLLNGQTINLSEDTLVIADDSSVLALAGVMGGANSAVSDATSNIFLECAFFAPTAISGKARQYGLHTDSSHRFERGVDPQLQHRALERATRLILDIAGGRAGPIVEIIDDASLPKRYPVKVRTKKITDMLGISLLEQEIEDIFRRLGMTVCKQADGWEITPPGFRFDIVIEADLIEEIARIYGYNKLPNESLVTPAIPSAITETALTLARVKNCLVDRGYQEAITYSFVDEVSQRLLAPGRHTIKIQNPISSDLSVMRPTLWCGLVKSALYNLNRQQNRVRLFESGLRFLQDGNKIRQEKMLAGLILGSWAAEQWGEKKRNVDFFDIKADVESLFALAGRKPSFHPAQHPALHPGQCAEILSEAGEVIGLIGMLHPSLEKQFGFETKVHLFEMNLDMLLAKNISRFKPLSKYPSVRRDLAVIVKEKVSVDEITSCVRNCTSDILQDIVIFDLYQGKGIEDNYKSVAIGITLQNFNQTLTDSEIDATFNQVLKTLGDTLGAKLRN